MADSHNHQAKRNARTAKWHLLLKHYLPASLPLSLSLSQTHPIPTLESKQDPGGRPVLIINESVIILIVHVPSTGVTRCCQLLGGERETRPENNPLTIETGTGLSGPQKLHAKHLA